MFAALMIGSHFAISALCIAEAQRVAVPARRE
jgi:hypothetical protein